MVDYVEYPTDTLVKIVVPKKKDPDDGGGGGDPRQGPCGMWTSVERAGGFFSPQPNGLFTLRRGQRTAGGVTESGLVWSHVSTVFLGSDGIHHYGGGIDYLWGRPTSWTVTGTYSYDIDADIPFEIHVWRNTDPQIWNPCTIGPTMIGEHSINIMPQQPTEAFPPIFMFINLGYPGGCSAMALTITVQGRCAQETDGGLPFQPPPSPYPWFGEWIGPALPGSIYYV